MPDDGEFVYGSDGPKQVQYAVDFQRTVFRYFVQNVQFPTDHVDYDYFATPEPDGQMIRVLGRKFQARDN